MRKKLRILAKEMKFINLIIFPLAFYFFICFDMDLNSSSLFVSISILILLYNVDMKHVPFCVDLKKRY